MDVQGIKRAAAKIVPKLLNFEQKQRRMDISQDMLTMLNDDPDLLKAQKAKTEKKRKIEKGDVGGIKKRVSKVFRGLEKTLA